MNSARSPHATRTFRRYVRTKNLGYQAVDLAALQRTDKGATADCAPRDKRREGESAGVIVEILQERIASTKL